MGANQGRAKGNKQRAEYENLEGRHERSGRRERGKPGEEAKAEKKGSTSGTAVGAKLGRMKGNKQEAEYEEPGKKARETRLGRTGKTVKA